jgi:hypothetical protein
MIRPQFHSFITGAAREGNTLVHELSAQVVAASGRIYQQDPQLRGGCIGCHTEHTAHPAAIELRDPRRFASRVVLAGVVRHNPRNERLETRIPSGDWLELLATRQPVPLRRSRAGTIERSLGLAVLRGALLDLLATGDEERTTAIVEAHVKTTVLGAGMGIAR